jgi:hypothetical protein
MRVTRDYFTVPVGEIGVPKRCAALLHARFRHWQLSDSSAHPIEPPERATLESARDATPED